MKFETKNLSGIKAELDVAFNGTRLLRAKLDDLYKKRIEISAVAIILAMVCITLVLLFHENLIVVAVGTVLMVIFVIVMPMIHVITSLFSETLIQKFVSIPLYLKHSGGIGAQNPNLVLNESRLGEKARVYLKKEKLSKEELEMFHILKIEWDDTLDNLIKTCRSL